MENQNGNVNNNVNNNINNNINNNNLNNNNVNNNNLNNNSNNNWNDIYNRNKKRKKRILFTVIGIILALLVIGGIIIRVIDLSNYYVVGNSVKPIIYLYPKETTELTVKLGKPENITCSYPKYINGWNVIANTDGTLIDKDTGRKLYSLYWEGINSKEFNTNDGFVVKGSETIEFLEEKLALLGLNEREAEEFIVYWLPILQENEYNYIRFATMDEINKNMPLEFSVKPDTIIRVLMQYKALDNYIEVKEQKLETPERTGFVAVEWGGTEIK